MPDGGDEQVRIAVVVHIRKRAGAADPARQPYARLLRDVFKLPAAQIAEQLIGPPLVDKINVQFAISIHIRHRHAVAMIIMARHPILRRIIHGAVLKGDAAGTQPVRKTKCMKCPVSFGLLHLPALQFRE